MNTESQTSMIVKGTAAAVVALVMTWALSWSFVDSTRIARWVTAADVAAAAAVQVDTSTVGGALKAGLLQ
ncbi:MAG: hypothetical protein MUF07_11260 [Steroidobacteraceae bacterium]|jgi:hypothetical protein|nr:hypothetical protein [Steroidobacteraceae bacterium]